MVPGRVLSLGVPATTVTSSACWSARRCWLSMPSRRRRPRQGPGYRDHRFGPRDLGPRCSLSSGSICEQTDPHMTEGSPSSRRPLGRGQLACGCPAWRTGLVGSSDSEPTAYRGSEFDLFRKEIPNFWGPFYARRLGRPAIKVAILGSGPRTSYWASRWSCTPSPPVGRGEPGPRSRRRPWPANPQARRAEAEVQDPRVRPRGGGWVGWAARGVVGGR